MGTHEFLRGKPSKMKVKTTGLLVQIYFHYFYSRITKATPLHNLEGILSMSHPLGWYTKMFLT